MTTSSEQVPAPPTPVPLTTGVNQGEFVINDLGTAVGGPGQVRLKINNAGDVIIKGNLITNAGS